MRRKLLQQQRHLRENFCSHKQKTSKKKEVQEVSEEGNAPKENYRNQELLLRSELQGTTLRTMYLVILHIFRYTLNCLNNIQQFIFKYVSQMG